MRIFERTRAAARRPGPARSAPLTFESPNLGSILNALDEERRQILELDDEARVLGALEELRTALTLFVVELDSESPRVVRGLRRQGWTFQRIAAASDVPPARVAQLARATLSSSRHRDPGTPLAPEGAGGSGGPRGR
jgi:hypothetical protein